MAFIRKDTEKKGLSLPGLIDIIFLLLIFSLVTLSITQAKVETKRRGDQSMEFPLPETKSIETEEVGGVLQTLMFQIEPSDPEDALSPKTVYVLWPSIQDSLSVEEARINAQRDSLFAVFPDDFLKISDAVFSKTVPCNLIQWAVQKYKEEHFFDADLSNSVEIRAVKNTEFRIVNFIMEQCSVYGDTIPRVVLRTLTARDQQDVY
jgi:hypothetical protein